MTERRKSVFTHEDLEQISDMIAHHSEHVNCRFGDINPDDLHKIIVAFNKLEVVMEDNRNIVRRFFIRFFLIGIIGLTCYGFWGKIYSMIKDVISGGSN